MFLCISLYHLSGNCFNPCHVHICTFSKFGRFRLYGFKIHPLAYQLQYQAAASFKMPMRGMGHNNSKR